MEKSENLFGGKIKKNVHSVSKKNNSLSRNEIVKGHNSYINILQNSVIFSTDYLKVFVNKIKDPVPVDFIQSPLLTISLKVGFIIAKKKIRKAVLRNRIRRLLKESYRLNKHLFSSIKNANVIFSLSEKGYNKFLNDPAVKIHEIELEMIKASEKIIKYFKVK